jgi:hypothetical protein
MNIEESKKLINEFIENRPRKEIYEKCLMELIMEKNNIMSNENYEKDLIEKIDKVIESIQIYLSIASK